VETLERMDDDDAEAAMMSTAIQLSLENQSLNDWSNGWGDDWSWTGSGDWTNGASSSSAGPSALTTRSAVAAFRADAADLEGFGIYHDYCETYSSEDEPLATMKGKTRAVKQTARRTGRSSHTQFTGAEKRKRRGVGSQPSIREEELELRKQLGRRLTHVRIVPFCPVIVIS
jgi:hypothetical protein